MFSFIATAFACFAVLTVTIVNVAKRNEWIVRNPATGKWVPNPKFTR